MTVSLYQTLRDRKNPREIEELGPFCCDYKNAWLGPGFYFWDSHEELGHWWGTIAHKQKGHKYVLCAASAQLDSRCWDLHGNGNHRKEYKDICDRLVKEGISKREDLLVFHVIYWAIKKNILCKLGYEAIRAMGIDTIPHREASYTDRMRFAYSKIQYLDLMPPVQVCLLKKDALNLYNYRIISPLKYVNL